MKTETHLDLALKICKEQLNKVPFYKRVLFGLGCVLPDFDPFSYLKGFRTNPFFGHNWENAKGYIGRSAQNIGNKGVGLRLGILVHYICDAFTFAHNEGFDGDLHRHTLYEKRLHDLVTKDGSHNFQSNFCDDPAEFIEKRHREYKATEQSLKTDADFILSVSSAVVNFCLQVQENQAFGSRTAER